MSSSSFVLPDLILDDTRGPQKKLHVTRSVELMENYVAGRAYAPGKEIAVASDVAGEPMIFSIGTTSDLHLVSRQHGKKIGWRQVALHGSLGKDRVFQTFGAFQMANGKIILAVAVASKTDPAASELHVTDPIANDPDGVDWTTLVWKPCPAPRADLTIREITIGRDAETEVARFYVSAQPPKGDAAYWSVEASTEWRELPLPTNAPDILDIAFGNHTLGSGAYVLYRAGAGAVLVFKTLDGETTVDLVPPKGAKKLAVLPNDRGLSDLYVAGDGLYVFSADLQRRSGRAPAEILGPKDAFPSRAIAACQDSQNLAFWLLTDDDRMIYLTRRKEDGAKWSEPVALRGNVAQMAPLRSPTRLCNEVIWVGTGGPGNRLGYVHQDPASRTWTNAKIVLKDAGEIVHQEASYIGHVGFTNERGHAEAEREITIESSAWVHATINGAHRSLGPGTPAKVKTDLAGMLVIATEVSNLATPLFHITTPGVATPIELDPAAKVMHVLENVTPDTLPSSADTKANATTRVTAARAVKELILISRTLKDDEKTRPKAVPRFWGAELGPSASFFDSAEPRPAGAGALVASEEPSWIENAIHMGSDILESLWQGLVTATRFVVRVGESITELFIDLGERAGRFVVDSVKHVASAIGWVLKECLGIDLAPAVKWLGFIFDWEDVRLTHRAIHRGAILVFDALIARADGVEAWIREKFVELRAHVVGATLPSSKSNEIFAQRPTEAALRQKKRATSPQEGWAMTALRDHMDDADPEAPSFGAEVIEIAFETLKTQWKIEKNSFDEIVETLVHASESTLGDVLEKLGTMLLENLLDTVENVALTFVQIAEAVLNAARKLVDARWNIPLLTPLYEKIIVPGSKLSLLDLLSLVVAIPMNLVCKAETGRNPVTLEQVLALETAKSFDALVAEWVPRGEETAPEVRSNLLRAGLRGEAPGAPTIASFTPTLGYHGERVTFTGTHLASVTEVVFHGDKSAKIADTPTATTLAAYVPKGFETGPILLRSPAGNVTSAQRFTRDQKKAHIENAQGFVGYFMSVTRYLAGLCYAIEEGADKERDREKKKHFQTAKVGFELLTYAGGFTNATISVAGAKKPTSARRNIDLAVQYGQVLPRLKDLFQVVYWWQRGDELAREPRVALALAESAFGTATFVLVCVSTGLQDQEPLAALSKDQLRKALGLKATQNLFTAVSQICNGPKTACRWQPTLTNPAPVLPEETLLKEGLILVRALIGVAIVPPLTFTRATTALVDGRQFVDN